MMRNKKGFTLVELVIVIAVIAILAAVLIPTFGSVIKNANNSADKQLVSNLNTVASNYLATGDGSEFESADNIRKMLAEEGISASNLKTKSGSSLVVYSTETEQFDRWTYNNDGWTIVNAADETEEPEAIGYYLEELFDYNVSNSSYDFKMIVSTKGNDLAEAIYALHNLPYNVEVAYINNQLKKIPADLKEKVQYILANSIFVTDKNGDEAGSERYIAIDIAEDGTASIVDDLAGRTRIIFHEHEQELVIEKVLTANQSLVAIIPGYVTNVYSTATDNPAADIWWAGNTSAFSDQINNEKVLTVKEARIKLATYDEYLRTPVSVEGELSWNLADFKDGTIADKRVKWNDFKSELIDMLVEKLKDQGVTSASQISITSMDDGTYYYGSAVEGCKDGGEFVNGGTYQLKARMNGDKDIDPVLVKFRTVQIASGISYNNADVTQWCTIEEALAKATSKQTIVVAGNTSAGALVTAFSALGREVTKYTDDNYTIKSDVTLLLPFDGIKEYQKEDEHITNAYEASGKTREQTLDAARTLELYVGEGIEIANNGTINIGGKTTGGVGGQFSGYTTGAFAQITLGDDAKIISNGSINAYGFIKEENTDQGSEVIMESGTLTMPFIIVEHRGGTAFANMVFDKMKSMLFVKYPSFSSDALKTSPFNRFFMENVTPLLTIESNANLAGRANLYAGDQANPTSLSLVGNKNTNLIQLADGAKVVSKYSASTQVNKLDIYGSINLNSLSLNISLGNLKDKLGNVLGSIADSVLGSLTSITLSTKSIMFPLSWYWNVTLKPFKDGSAATVNATGQDIKVLPGASLTIEKGVTVNARKIAVYDSADVLQDSQFKYEQDKGPGVLMVNGILNVNTIAGYVQAGDNDGAVLNISGSTSITAKEVKTHGNDQGWNSILPEKDATEYNDFTLTLTLDVNSNGTSSKTDNQPAGSYVSEQGGWKKKEN